MADVWKKKRNGDFRIRIAGACILELEIIPESYRIPNKPGAMIALSTTYETVICCFYCKLARSKMRFRDIRPLSRRTTSNYLDDDCHYIGDLYFGESGERTADGFFFISLLSAYPLPVKVYE